MAKKNYTFYLEEAGVEKVRSKASKKGRSLNYIIDLMFGGRPRRPVTKMHTRLK